MLICNVGNEDAQKQNGGPELVEEVFFLLLAQGHRVHFPGDVWQVLASFLFILLFFEGLCREKCNTKNEHW